MPLSNAVIKYAKPCKKTARLYDSGGLYLGISPAGGKWWRLKYRYCGEEKRLSLGVYPDVLLAEARMRQSTYRALLTDGIDPSEHAKMEKAAQRASEARQIAATRFSINNDGALFFRFGNHRMALTPAETVELRDFLDATRAVTPKETPCP